MYPLKITFSENFNEKYQEYRQMLVEILAEKEKPAIEVKENSKLIDQNQQISNLDDNDVKKIKDILDVINIRLAIKKPPYIVYIPLIDFPDSIKRFEVIALIYKIDRDLGGALRFTQITDGAEYSKQEVCIRVEDDKAKFIDFKRVIDKKYNDIIKNKNVDINTEKSEEIQPQPEDKKQDSNPYTEVKNGIGYFKFYKEGKNIKIGKEKTRHFRFLQSLCIPKLGTQKTIEEVFEAIKNDKDLKDSVLTGFDTPQKKTRMITIMKNSCIKELQKNQELKKISYKFDNTEKRVWLKLEE